MATAISLRGLRKHFGDVRAVDGIDLEIADGEFFSMLGPSGSGKTTVLRMIAGFEQPDRRARSCSAATTSPAVPPFDRDVNTVFQDYALFPHMTVAQNVEYGLRVKKVAAGRAARAGPTRRWPRCGSRASATAGRTSSPAASGSGSRWPAPWSTGPRVLLLDEPLGALDLKLRERDAGRAQGRSSARSASPSSSSPTTRRRRSR